MQSMVTEGENKCPFSFNLDPATFKKGDLVSYRVPDLSGDMPFVGELLEVHDDYVILKHFETNEKPVRGTREVNPAVSKEDALA